MGALDERLPPGGIGQSTDRPYKGTDQIRVEIHAKGSA